MKSSVKKQRRDFAAVFLVVTLLMGIFPIGALAWEDVAPHGNMGSVALPTPVDFFGVGETVKVSYGAADLDFEVPVGGFSRVLPPGEFSLVPSSMVLYDPSVGVTQTAFLFTVSTVGRWVVDSGDDALYYLFTEDGVVPLRWRLAVDGSPYGSLHTLQFGGEYTSNVGSLNAQSEDGLLLGPPGFSNSLTYYSSQHVGIVIFEGDGSTCQYTVFTRSRVQAPYPSPQGTDRYINSEVVTGTINGAVEVTWDWFDSTLPDSFRQKDYDGGSKEFVTHVDSADHTYAFSRTAFGFGFYTDLPLEVSVAKQLFLSDEWYLDEGTLPPVVPDLEDLISDLPSDTAPPGWAQDAVGDWLGQITDAVVSMGEGLLWPLVMIGELDDS